MRLKFPLMGTKRRQKTLSRLKRQKHRLKLDMVSYDGTRFFVQGNGIAMGEVPTRIAEFVRAVLERNGQIRVDSVRIESGFDFDVVEQALSLFDDDEPEEVLSVMVLVEVTGPDLDPELAPVGNRPALPSGL